MYSVDNSAHTGLSPIIKWAGGKEKELPFIFSNAPQTFENYYEPFVGGGAVFTAFPAKRHYINDKSEELIALYRCIATSDGGFFQWLGAIMQTWETMLEFIRSQEPLCSQYVEYRTDGLSDGGMAAAIAEFLTAHSAELNAILERSFTWHRGVYGKELKKNLIRKTSRMKQIERAKGNMPPADIFSNIETAFMSALYMYFRHLYNDRDLMRSDLGLGTAVFVFIRNYAYSGMFRYSSRGLFNVPYGGIGYNHKLLNKKVTYYQSAPLLQHFGTTSIHNLDFEDFLTRNPPQENDFVFLDPPYDSEFSTYAQNEFSQDDQRRLASYLISRCRAKWMMVIKNTPFILSLYEEHQLTIKTFDKKYIVSFMNRNDKRAEHLIIMNY